MLTLSFWGADGLMITPETLTSGMVGAKIAFQFSEDWEGLNKTAVFMAGNTIRAVSNVEDAAEIPADVLAAPGSRLYVGIYGESEDGTLVIPTICVAGPKIQYGADPLQAPAGEPPVTSYARLLAMIGDLTELKTEAKDSLVAALNEMFTNSSNGSSADTGGNSGSDSTQNVVLYDAQKLTADQQAQARTNIGAAEAVGVIPDYWEEHLNEKIAIIKKHQRENKDCYSFVVVTDYHCYGNKKHSPAMIKRIMDECGIKFCLCLGDIQNGGAWNTKELDLAEWDKIENEFSPIRDRTLMIPGNHDGAYGSVDINGDGEIAGTTDYYIYNLTPAEVYDLILRKVGLISGVTFDASKNGYYVDDPVSKVRYILVNTHYSDGATNEDGTAINNYMRKIRVGQPQQDMMVSALQSVPGDDWTVVVGMHIPLAPMSDSGPSADMAILRDVLEAYQNKATYSNTYGTEGSYDYVSVSVDFTTAKGTVVGAFCGHIHQDDVNTDFDFPIIASLSDNVNSAKFDEVVVPGEAGTTTEQSFDVFTVNPGTGVIHATKIGYGSDRRFPETDYTNLADPASADWHNHAYLNSGTVVTDSNGVADQIVTNFIPVTQYDILRWKGLDNERGDMSGPGIQMFDENKEYIGSQNINAAGANNTIYPVMTTDENGVTSYEILMRGSTGQQFVYNDWCTRTKFIRFSCCPLGAVGDIVITVNEEIV